MRALRQIGRNYAELYGYVLRVPGARFVLSGAYWSVPIPTPGSSLWTACMDLRNNPPII
jgi:hypothetical protein